ncbi:MAG: RDD family protein, partial [Gemmatimonadaceae bacterium]|nr:RDD family protein [Gemmatimonadaceae bacterium]
MTTTARSGVPTAAPALEQRVDVETPELVTFSYTVAGIGSRAAAAVIDTLIMIVLITGIWMLIGAVAGAIGPVVSAAERMSGAWAIAIALLVAFAIQWGYYVLFEAIWDGQTPGKRLLKIRVVQDGGYSVSFAASAARNIVRIVDMQPVITYAVGIVSAALSRSGKRLGDLVAGTFVVHERVTAGAPVAASGEELRATPVSAALSVAEYELLDRFLARRASLDPDRRTAMAAQLADRFAAHLPPADGTPALARLLQLHASETAARARGGL